MRGVAVGDRLQQSVDSHADLVAGWGEAGCYRFVGGSAIGQMHLKRGKPREDAFAVRAAGPWIAIAVSDGVGSCPSSRFGSSFVVDILCEHLLRAAMRASGAGEPERAERPRSANPAPSTVDPGRAAEAEAHSGRSFARPEPRSSNSMSEPRSPGPLAPRGPSYARRESVWKVSRLTSYHDRQKASGRPLGNEHLFRQLGEPALEREECEQSIYPLATADRPPRSEVRLIYNGDPETGSATAPEISEGIASTEEAGADPGPLALPDGEYHSLPPTELLEPRQAAAEADDAEDVGLDHNPAAECESQLSTETDRKLSTESETETGSETETEIESERVLSTERADDAESEIAPATERKTESAQETDSAPPDDATGAPVPQSERDYARNSSRGASTDGGLRSSRRHQRVSSELGVSTDRPEDLVDARSEPLPWVRLPQLSSPRAEGAAQEHGTLVWLVPELDKKLSLSDPEEAPTGGMLTAEDITRAFRRTHEGLGQFARSRGMAMNDLACTLLGVVVNTETGAVAVGHIGDGLIVGRNSINGTTRPLVEPIVPERFREVYPFTRDDWESFFRTEVLWPQEPGDLETIFVMTDGVSQDCDHGDALPKWASSMNGEIRSSSEGAFAATRLVEWLASYTHPDSYDDRTLVVVYRAE